MLKLLLLLNSVCIKESNNFFYIFLKILAKNFGEYFFLFIFVLETQLNNNYEESDFNDINGSY